jgi:high-affinity nickel-transport protein
MESTSDGISPPRHNRNPLLTRASKIKARCRNKLSRLHSKIPYLRRLPLSAILIISFLIIINLVTWAICGLILAFRSDNHLLGTAALAYSLGLRHALDADHITAIDLMTRRLIATGHRPVTVGTFFSLGHSTIVIITSIVVAATAAGVSKRFDGFGKVGSIIGTSVSAAFLLLLGILNAYILFRLVLQMKKIINLQPDEAAEEAWKIQGGGVLFRVLKRMFKLIDRPWKMYPLGVLFGLGFDTSSEIALLGISSIQGARGTSIWLILIFPVLFTAGMCLVDTIDGALMMSLYVAPMEMSGDEDKKDHQNQHEPYSDSVVHEQDQRSNGLTHSLPELDSSTDNPQTFSTANLAIQSHVENSSESPHLRSQVKDPLTFLYYSIVLTTLTVVCAIIIGVIQLLSLILNVADVSGPFWNGVASAGDHYEIIGAAICGSFIVCGLVSVLLFRCFRRWVNGRRAELMKAQGAPVVHGEAVETEPEVLGQQERLEQNDAVRTGVVAATSHSEHVIGDVLEIHGKGTASGKKDYSS